MSFKIYPVLLLILLMSCQQKREVFLPKVQDLGVDQVEDLSSAYIFYAPEEPDSILLNRKNLISTTNWIVHVDKRLTLKQCIKQIKTLQEKRTRAGMHKNEAARNYFSATDTLNKQLVFIDFTDIQFLVNDQYSKFYIKEHPEEHMEVYTLTINFDKNNRISVNENEVDRGEFVNFFNDYVPFAAAGKESLVYVNFDETLSFQEYMEDWELVEQVLNDNIRCSPLQFVYNYEALPECDCRL